MPEFLPTRAMLNRRYLYRDAARVAAPVVAVVGLLGGIGAARAVPASPTLIVNAVIWGLAGAGTGYLIFASEGPQQRPASVVQAVVADGVVAGILTAMIGGLIDVIGASGAGSSSPGALSAGGSVVALAIMILYGGLAGAGAGAAALALGGRARFERGPERRTRNRATDRRATAGKPRPSAGRRRPKR